MNENIDLTKILKDCPIGTKLYLTLCGEVKLIKVENDTYPICVQNSNGDRFWLTKDGKYISSLDGECILFPSKEQKDWSKFTKPGHKNGKFDPKTLQPFDKVLVRDDNNEIWFCSSFSHIQDEPWTYQVYCTASGNYYCCVPYNDDTKHIVGTTEAAPEYYRYWE